MAGNSVLKSRKRQISVGDNCVTTECPMKKCELESDGCMFMGDHHASKLLSRLNAFRKNQEFCDVTLQIGENQKFAAHRNVLAAVSPYLKTMFQREDSEPVEYIIEVQDIEMEIMSLMLDYAYTGSVSITKSNCKRLILAANLMQVTALRNAASEYFEKHADMDVDNCFSILNFAQSNGCSNLKKMALNFILKNFDSVAVNEEFLELSTDEIIKITRNDKLEVNNEAVVFSAVMRWFEHRPIDRSNDICKILETVRLPLIDTYFLYDIPKLFPSLKAKKDCMKLLDEAKAFHLVPDRCMEINTIRTRPREKSGIMQVIAVVGGEIRHSTGEGSSSIECFAPSVAKWFSLSSLFNITRHGTAISGKNNLYVGGGKAADGRVLNRFWRYDFYFDVIQEMSPILTARCSMGLVADDGFVYVVGGFSCDNNILGSIERYDPNTNKWSFFQKLKKPVASAAIVVHDRVLFIAGGLDSSKGDITSEFYQYDFKTDTWTSLPSLLIPRCAATSCVLDGYIYVIGGCYTSIEFTSRVDRYSITNRRWEETSPLLERRGGAGVAVMDGKIYVLGGTKEKSPYPDTIECYDPEKGSWSIVGKLLSPRAWLSCASFKIKKSCCKEVNLIEIVD